MKVAFQIHKAHWIQREFKLIPSTAADPPAPRPPGRETWSVSALRNWKHRRKQKEVTGSNHGLFLDTLSSWLARAKNPHMGERCGNPRTCKGLFSIALSQISSSTAARSAAKGPFPAYITSPTLRPFLHVAPTPTTVPATPTRRFTHARKKST